jgi:predicted GNAT family acetyltransferase
VNNTDASEPVVTRNDGAGRYELHISGELAAFATFIPGDGSIVFTHTETLPEFAGRGVGLTLAKAAIAQAVERGDTIIPLCPFFRRYLERNDVPGANVHFPEAR